MGTHYTNLAFSSTAFSDDTGVGGDEITNVGSQTVSGTLNVTTGSGSQKFWISLDGGVTWTDAGLIAGAIIPASGTGVSWSVPVTLTQGAHGIDIVASGGGTPSGAQAGSVHLGYDYDPATANNTVSGIALSDDTGLDNTDGITTVAAQTISATLSSPLATGSGDASAEHLWASTDNGASWTDISGSVSGTSVHWDTTLSGSDTLLMEVRDAAGNSASASHTYEIVSGPPHVVSAELTAGAAPGGYLHLDDVVIATVTMDANATVDTTSGMPYLQLDIGGQLVQATYAAGSGTNQLLFIYQIELGDADADGISIVANSLNSGGGTITGGAGDAAVLTHAGATDNVDYLVDAAPPSAPTISVVDNLGVPVADGANTDGLTPTLSGTAEAGSTVTIVDTDDIDGTSILGLATMQPDGSWTFTPSHPLNVGPNEFTAFATDAAGNVGDQTTYTITTFVPTDPPGAPNDLLVVDDYGPFDANGNPLLILDGDGNPILDGNGDPIPIPTYVGPVADGTNTNDQTPTLSGTAEAGSLIKIFNSAPDIPELVGTAVTDIDGHWTFTPATDLSFTPNGDFTGEYDFYATATDAAGNESDPSTPYTIFIQQNAVCFLPGTLIATLEGERPIESLAIGEMITLADGRQAPLKWLGRMTVNLSRFNRHTAKTILIRAGALGNGLPKRDVYTTYYHGFELEGLLVHAGLLVNGTSIVQCTDWPESSVTYYQVEVEGHELMLVEGSSAETFGDTGEVREKFDNADEFWRLYPDAPSKELMTMGHVTLLRQLPRSVKERIDAAARLLGYESVTAAAA